MGSDAREKHQGHRALSSCGGQRDTLWSTGHPPIPPKSGLYHFADLRGIGAVYSITSSAVASSVGGTSRLSVLAVLRLITNSNLVGN
jgi:hypothetical protein